MAGPVTPEAIRAEILRQTAARGPEKSICPSEVARALEPEDWRRHMTAVRGVAATLSAEGALDILRKGRPVPPEAMHGVIRLRARAAE